MEKERKRRTFSAEYKAETVRLIQRSGKSIGQMAWSWDRRDRAAALGGAGGDRSGTGTRRSDQAQRTGGAGGVRRENQRLRMEREISQEGGFTSTSPVERSSSRSRRVWRAYSTT